MIGSTTVTDANAGGRTSASYLVIWQHTGEGGPGIAINKSSVDFGNIAIGESVTQTITVTSIGWSPLSISGVSTPPDYTITPNPPASYPILIGDSHNFDITFTPSTVGSSSGNIIIQSNIPDGGTTNLPVTGNAYDPEVTTILALSKGWNLVSVPRVQSDYSPSVVFPGALGVLFKYDPTLGDYVEAPTLELGWGYWVYYTSARIVSIVGTKPCPITIHCKVGWNLIGSCPDTVAVGDIVLSNGSIYGAAFKYDPVLGDYVETSVILPGQAAWIFVAEECDLTLPCECE
jgi:hypothetical protein